MRRLLLVFVLALVAGCSRHVSVSAPDGIVHGDGYSYRKLDDGNFAVASQDLPKLAQALHEIGCGKRYVCAVKTDDLEYSVVTVHAK